MKNAVSIRRTLRVVFLVVLAIGFVPVFLGWWSSLTAPAGQVVPSDGPGGHFPWAVASDHVGDGSGPTGLSSPARSPLPPALPRSTWAKLRILFQ